MIKIGDCIMVLELLFYTFSYIILTSLIKSFQCKKLTLQFVSPLHHENIGCLAGHKDFLFSSVADKVFSWIRGKLVRTYVGHSADVTHLLPFGDHIISFG